MVWLIVLFGLLIRMINLNQSLWLDEAITAQTIKNYNPLTLLINYIPYDFHPVGYYQILWIWGKLFGYSEVALRVPSVVFGVLVIYFVYKIGELLKNKKTGIIAAILMAVNPLAVYYSQEARMYSFAMFATTLSVYYLFKIIRKKHSLLDFIFYSLSLILILASDYLAYFIIPVQIYFILTLKDKKDVVSFIKSFIPVSLLGLLWLPVFFKQINQGLSIAENLNGWKQVVGSFGIKPLALTYIKFIIGRISQSNDLLYGILITPVIALFSLVLYRVRNGTLWEFLFIPIIMAWSVSYFVPIYDYFRMLYLVPIFILLVSIGVTSFKGQLFYGLVTLLLLVQIISTAIYLFNPSFHREDWIRVVKLLRQTDNQVLIESDDDLAPLEYYLADKEVTPALIKVPAKSIRDVVEVDSQSVLLINYLVEITDPDRFVDQKLVSLGYKLTDTYNYNGVGFIYRYIKQ